MWTLSLEKFRNTPSITVQNGAGGGGGGNESQVSLTLKLGCRAAALPSLALVCGPFPGASCMAERDWAEAIWFCGNGCILC